MSRLKQYAADGPFVLLLVELDDGKRVLGRFRRAELPPISVRVFANAKDNEVPLFNLARGYPMKLQPITRANRPARKEVLMARGTAELIKDGDVIIVGGFGTVNHPMTILRGLIRRKVKNLTVIGAATAGLNIDLMIGAGCVRKVIAPYIGAELHAPIGHCYRAAAENDEIEVYETTEYLRYSQFDAAARELGFLPWRAGVGTSIPVLNPDYVPFNDPINGEPYLAVPALARRLGDSSTLDRLTRTAMASMAVRDLATACCRARPSA